MHICVYIINCVHTLYSRRDDFACVCGEVSFISTKISRYFQFWPNVGHGVMYVAVDKRGTHANCVHVYNT